MVEKQIFSVKWIRSTQISWFNPIHLWNKPMIMNPQSQIIAKKKFNISKHPVFIVSLFPFLMAQIETLCWWQNQSPKSNQSYHQHISSSIFVTSLRPAKIVIYELYENLFSDGQEDDKIDVSQDYYQSPIIMQTQVSQQMDLSPSTKTEKD